MVCCHVKKVLHDVVQWNKNVGLAVKKTKPFRKEKDTKAKDEADEMDE